MELSTNGLATTAIKSSLGVPSRYFTTFGRDVWGTHVECQDILTEIWLGGNLLSSLCLASDRVDVHGVRWTSCPCKPQEEVGDNSEG